MWKEFLAMRPLASMMMSEWQVHGTGDRGQSRLLLDGEEGGLRKYTEGADGGAARAQMGGWRQRTTGRNSQQGIRGRLQGQDAD